MKVAQVNHTCIQNIYLHIPMFQIFAVTLNFMYNIYGKHSKFPATKLSWYMILDYYFKLLAQIVASKQ